MHLGRPLARPLVAESSRSAFRPRTREADAENTQAGWQLLTLQQTRVAAGEAQQPIRAGSRQGASRAIRRGDDRCCRLHAHAPRQPKPRLKATVRPARPDCQNPAWPKCVMSPPHAPDIVKTVVLAARHALGSIVNVEQDGVVLGRTGLNGTAHVL